MWAGKVKKERKQAAGRGIEKERELEKNDGGKDEGRERENRNKRVGKSVGKEGRRQMTDEGNN